jgi:hypothetical protein
MVSPSRSAAPPSVDLDDNLGQYRAVSGLAIVGLLAGLASVLAFLQPLLWLLPLAAIVINVLALRQIADALPQLIGRKAALTGLALALICGISAPIQRWIYLLELRAGSIEIAHEWFTALRENRPDYAHRLTLFPSTLASRATPPDEHAMAGAMSSSSLPRFTEQSPMNLLLRLGKKAHIRLYANEEVWSTRELEGVRDYYVVTVGEGTNAVSFFIRFGTSRSVDLATGDWEWQVTKYDFVTTPSPALLEAAGG